MQSFAGGDSELQVGKGILWRRRWCIPLGRRDLPQLPNKELAALKETVISVFPIYRRNPVKFEEISLQQLCKHL